jgi:hypothetical protein
MRRKIGGASIDVVCHGNTSGLTAGEGAGIFYTCQI